MAYSKNSIINALVSGRADGSLQWVKQGGQVEIRAINPFLLDLWLFEQADFPISLASFNEKLSGKASSPIRQALHELMTSNTPYQKTELKEAIIECFFQDNEGIILLKFSSSLSILKNEKAILDTQTALIVRVDLAGRLQYFNQAYLDKFGKKAEELKGEKFIFLVHPDDRKNTLSLLEQVYEPPYQIKLEQRVMTPKGWRWLEWDDKAIFGENNEIVGVQGVGRDITEYKRALKAKVEEAEKYRALNQRFQVLAKYSRDLVCLHDDELNFTYTSPAVRSLTGYDQQELAGKNLLDFVHPNDRSLLYELTIEAHNGVEQQDLQYRFKSKKSGYLWFEVLFEFIKEPVYPTEQVLSVSRDITKRKLSQEEVLAKKDKLLTGVASANTELLVNQDFAVSIQNALEMAGKAAEADRCYIFQNHYSTSHKTWCFSQIYEWANEGVVPQIDNPVLQNIKFEEYNFFIEPIKSGNPLYGHVHDFQDDELREVLQMQDIQSILVFPILINGHFWGSIGFDYCKKEKEWTKAEFELMRSFATSIAGAFESELTAKELKEAKRQADAANKAKSEFLAMVSHEIRTPINGMNGLTELTLATPLTEIQRKYLTKAYESGRSLLSIINDVLDFSKIEAGKMEIEAQDFSFGKLLEDIISIISPKEKATSIEFVVDVAPDLPNILHADGQRLKQVLINLLGNAFKFTEKGHIVLKAYFQAEGAAEGQLHFEVADSGIGISEKQQRVIFDSFTQADGSITRKYGGTGLGLSISKKIVDLMGGNLTFQSELGKGTTFQLNVPVKRPPSKEPSPNDVPLNQKILLVDDHVLTLAVLQKLCHFQQVQCDTAANGIEALALLEENSYDTVVVDLNMPFMNGYDFFEKAKALRPSASMRFIVLLCGAKEDVVYVEKFRENQVSTFLQKPILPRHLIDVLEAQKSQMPDTDEGIGFENQKVFNGSARILVVDDNQINVFLIQEIITNYGFNVDKALEGKKALKLLQERKYDMVFMDLHMPETDGREVTRQIRKMDNVNAKIPVVALTANALEEDKQSCFAAGMNDYVAKPYCYQDIKNMLDKHLNIKD